jgi:hypothetical protein
MQFSGKDVVEFLRGANTVRDGNLTGLTLAPGETGWDVVLHLTFQVPRSPRGDRYDLALQGDLSFGYDFSSETTLGQIAFVKCLWTDEATFYLSLDPWKESEPFPSTEDGDWFRSKFVSLTISGLPS